MRNIVVVTGNRAEYWLLRPLMTLLKNSPDINLHLVVTGEHLLGPGLQKIQYDGFMVSTTVKCLTTNDSHAAMTQAISKGVAGFGILFEKERPDIVVLLGDRSETFAAAMAAYTQKIPIAHLHGGEVTHGALDEGMRHMTSKMASLHFVSHQKYKERLIRMGESPYAIHLVGTLAVENLFNFKPKKREELFKDQPNFINDDYFLVTFHPPTLDDIDLEVQANNIINALNFYPDCKIIITASNSDPGGRKLNEIWNEWALVTGGRVLVVPALGDNYLHVAFYASLVIGNSSSGVIEIPYFDKPIINIGKRQIGRIFPTNVTQVNPCAESIKTAVAQQLTMTKNIHEKIYGTPGIVSQKIVDVLRTAPLQSLVYKEFYDAI